MHEPFWHYTDAKGTEHGPVTADTVRVAFQAGHVGPRSQFWHEGLPAWIDLPAAAAELGVVPGAPGAAAPPAPDPYATPRAPLQGGPAVVDSGDVVPAGFWRRFAAMMVDSLVVVVPVFLIAMALGVAMAVGGANSSEASGAIIALFYLVVFLVRGLYFAAMESSAGQATLGKRALGIKVVGDRGERITFGHALGRWFAAALSYLTFYVGFIMAAFTERKRALHDMVVNTEVVDRWAYTDHPERQQRELSGCLVTVIVASVLMFLVIPAIFAAIAVSQYQDYTVRAQVSEGTSLADGMKTAVAEYYHNSGRFPATNDEVGLAKPEEISGRYVGSAAVTDGGRIVVTYSSGKLDSGVDYEEHTANAAIDGKQLLFTPTAQGDSIQWQCSSDTLEQKWCPSICTCQ